MSSTAFMSCAAIHNKQIISGGERVTVCHLSLTLCTGGLERLLVDFARFHDRERYQLQFVAMREVGRFADCIRDCGCNVHQLTQQGRIGVVRELIQFFRQHEIGVLHTHNLHPHLYGTAAARLAGVPVVVNTRHGRRYGDGWKSRLQNRLASRFADRIVAVSDDAAQLCIDADGIDHRRVSRIWNGIDTDLFSFHGPASGPIAISVARLVPGKDFPTLLKAMHKAAREIPELELWIVGEGPMREHLENLCRELGLSRRVQFLGDRDDVPELLAQASFFVSSSLSEGISLTLLEAMAVGLPLVTTNVGGNPEIVEEGVTGQLVPPGDPDRLARSMIELCRHPQRGAEQGFQGRRRVVEHFDVRRMVSDYAALYDELRQHTPSPSTAAG